MKDQGRRKKEEATARRYRDRTERAKREDIKKEETEQRDLRAQSGVKTEKCAKAKERVERENHID